MGQGIVRITHCENCKNVTSVVRAEQQLLQVIGLGLLQRPPGMTGEELRYLRGLLEMTQADLAKALGLPRRETVAEWERKRRIFATPRDEITPRLILLHLFKQQVIESDHCALLPPHVEVYDEFVESFVEYAGTVLRERKKRPPSDGFNVRLKQRTRWSSDLVPA
jgi:DNA-binding transcriptional regulator YiaG